MLNPMHPVEIDAQEHASPEGARDRVGNLQFQKDAKELAEICASIPGDTDGVKQGSCRKTWGRSSSMEKLSKHIREQLTRTTISQ